MKIHGDGLLPVIVSLPSKFINQNTSKIHTKFLITLFQKAHQAMSKQMLKEGSPEMIFYQFIFKITVRIRKRMLNQFYKIETVGFKQCRLLTYFFEMLI